MRPGGYPPLLLTGVETNKKGSVDMIKTAMTRVSCFLTAGLLLGAGIPACEKSVEASPEMKGFLSSFGRSSSIAAALKANTAPGVDTHNMGMYDLKEPKVVSSETKGAATCYTFEAKAGITTRSYSVCWEGGKINSIADNGMK